MVRGERAAARHGGVGIILTVGWRPSPQTLGGDGYRLPGKMSRTVARACAALRHSTTTAEAGTLDTNSPTTDRPRGRGASGGLIGYLLRFPLFYKILVANAVIVALVTIGSVMIARAAAENENVTLALLLGVGVVLSVISNAIILRLALTPLKALEHTSRRVQEGELTARVPASDLADRDLERLAATLNMMLDSAESYRARLREVAARALNAQEEERRRIAQELHDGIAQTLTALRVRLRVARSAEGDERAEALERIGADIGAATEEIRRIAQGLRPPALDMLGLSPAIESYARTVAEASGLAIQTDIAATDGALSPAAELALYRIVQEALSNAARHSGASAARVDLEVTRDAVQAVVSDDGCGFSVQDEMSRGGLGLFGMQERGAYLGGVVEIESTPGRGTRVRVTIPTLETARYA
jgi:two-component system sensor histidine kinase UhpB